MKLFNFILSIHHEPWENKYFYSYKFLKYIKAENPFFQFFRSSESSFFLFNIYNYYVLQQWKFVPQHRNNEI